MAKEQDILRVIVHKVVSKAQAYIEEGKRLERSFWDTLSSLNIQEDEASWSKDEFVSASNHYFERAKKHTDFF